MRTAHNTSQSAPVKPGFSYIGQTTDELFEATHAALTQGRWGASLRMLDDLARRTDGGFDLLSTVDQYSYLASLGGKPRLTGDYRQMFADRIELANERVLRRL